MRQEEKLSAILKIATALSYEKDHNKLFDLIIEKSMELTGCDAGTLYLNRDGVLVFKIMKTLSMNISKGEHGEEIDLPPVKMSEENICAYSAIHRETMNIVKSYILIVNIY